MIKRSKRQVSGRPVKMFSCTPDKEILNLTLGEKVLSYPDYPAQGKIKIENSHVFDMHLL